jgi:cytosine/adenosine deaminase-related metal-dependent hydrolase
MLLRARIVLPVSRPPIADGAVLVEGNRIAAVGRWRDLSRANGHDSARDLGGVILLPGLVNAHCHLDYTDMGGQPPTKRFPDWIKGILARKAEATYADYAQAWLRGAAMLARNGVTTVGDIEAVPELLPDVWTSTPLRVASFLELTGVRSKRDPLEIVQEAAGRIRALKPDRGYVSLSPHALYSTTPELLREVAKISRQKSWQVTMHVSESLDEFDMYANRRGPFFEWMKSQRDPDDCGQGTPVEQIEKMGLLSERFLAVHANYLKAGDIQLLAESGSSVVHCPRSHVFFQHEPFPYQALARAGVNVCLGTDSLASIIQGKTPAELNLFTEMKVFAAANPKVDPLDIIRMATINGAKALNLPVGELAGDSFADMIAIPYENGLTGAGDAIVNHKGPVDASMIEGNWVIQSQDQG